MSQKLADRLNAARRSHIVGRAFERELFESALGDNELPFFLLYIYGPGGVGKTTLLRECALICERRHIPCIYLDSRNIDPSPDDFTSALRQAIDLGPQESYVDAIASRTGKYVLLLDTFEALAPLDGWLRETFLPQLPENVLIVISSRNGPSQGWRSDPGWQTMIRTLPLRNLSPEESRALLLKRHIPANQHQAVLDFTHGHPLALSLVADVFAQRGDFEFSPEDSPDVVKALLEQLVQKVPSPAHRAALEASALVRVTTESLLAAMLEMPDPGQNLASAAHDIFEWLRELSFIETRRSGLFPHDLTREALTADLRWRNPDWYAELHRRARVYYNQRLSQVSLEGQQQVLLDYVYLHRDNPMVKPFMEWQTSGSLLAESMRESDLPDLIEMVALHEGEESAALARHWLCKQSKGVTVWRDSEGQPAGFLSMVVLEKANPEDIKTDPGTSAAWEYLKRQVPLRPGESAILFRFWMARETHQAVSGIQSLAFINMVRYYLSTPGLAYAFLSCADPDFWAPVLTYANLSRIVEMDFTVGGKRYGVYGHDWRKTPPMAWLAMLAETEIINTARAAPAPVSGQQMVVLSQEEFTSAVRDALRDYARPDLLAGNPLLCSRLVVDGTSTGANQTQAAEKLRNLIREAASTLQATPRDAKLYRAIYHTYFQPAPTQEMAAEILDLPFSTYRRHLKTGIARITEILWQREVK